MRELRIGYRIQQLRNNRQLSRQAFSEMIGVSQEDVISWEEEKMIPDLENIIKISDLFEVSTDFLLLGKECSRKIDKNQEKYTNLGVRLLLICFMGLALLPLLSKLMQLTDRIIGMPYYTEWTLYLSEAPIVFIKYMLFAYIIIGIVFIFRKKINRIIKKIRNSFDI